MRPAAQEDHAGTRATRYDGNVSAPAGLPGSLSVADVTALAGERLPIGLDATRAPGPYRAAWSGDGELHAWGVEGFLLDARRAQGLAVTLSGGGLNTPRTITVADPAALPSTRSAQAEWRVDPGHVRQAAAAATVARSGRGEAAFWGRAVPVALLLAAAVLLLAAYRDRRRLDAGHLQTSFTTTHATSPRSTSHAR